MDAKARLGKVSRGFVASTVSHINNVSYLEAHFITLVVSAQSFFIDQPHPYFKSCTSSPRQDFIGVVAWRSSNEAVPNFRSTLGRLTAADGSRVGWSVSAEAVERLVDAGRGRRSRPLYRTNTLCWETGSDMREVGLGWERKQGTMYKKNEEISIMNE